ncbi:hypothetical protein HPB47_026352 [Ixodes persulcatus]|uniref:Uncharacterized protein n=1 Tax=Ixodes persulcatus TaxID=34615 RepID=A0AC60Q0T3_IXOPE|nr:hypothetical protein HPB47_026352 [Ixodes persulcatus]
MTLRRVVSVLAQPKHDESQGIRSKEETINSLEQSRREARAACSRNASPDYCRHRRGRPVGLAEQRRQHGLDWPGSTGLSGVKWSRRRAHQMKEAEERVVRCGRVEASS